MLCPPIERITYIHTYINACMHTYIHTCILLYYCIQRVLDNAIMSSNWENNVRELYREATSNTKIGMTKEDLISFLNKVYS